MKGERKIMASTNIDIITKSDPHTEELQAISFTVHYPNGSAKLHMVMDGSRSKQLSRTEVIRLEIIRLIDALEEITTSSESIRVAERVG
jgi:hypothetical protein